MDDYPAFSLDHNLPLLVTLGIAPETPYKSTLEPGLKEQAILLRSDSPLVDSDQAKALLKYFQSRDASDLPWNGREAKRGYTFRVRAAERTLLLPPRQARLPENIEAPETPSVLHSPFSPLSPICPLYPDGIIDVRWLAKHHELIPSVLLCFYSLTSDPTLTTLEDNKIKTDVNNIRSLLSQSGYRTRLAVVLTSDKAPSSVEGVQERLENIRKGCGVDQKAFFLVPPKDSQEALERSADTVLSAIYGLAVDYYRDMGRHARKKRGRGVVPQPTVPPTSGTSQTLSLAGWNVRYDFKSAVFAEYRQEMDNALRSYEQAYDSLLGPELFETIPSWSPRWNEARFLADVIATRSIRCMLWNGLPSAAVRRWQSHHDKIRDLLDRRGRGTSNYGWAAWEARWAEVMSGLIGRVEIPDLASSTATLFLQPEKGLLGERLQPWELLHHPGYWYHLASRHHYIRRTLAHAMPEEDRRSPSDSPASRVASKAFTYDTYMCPDPHDELPLHHTGTDHARLIVDALIRSRSEFQKRKQTRFATEISLECARELTATKEWKKIVELLQPLWSDSSFRAEGWINIAEEMNWSLRRAASMAGEASLVVAIDWELLNRTFTRRQNWHYDMTKSLDGVTSVPKAVVKTKEGDLGSSFVASSFVFKHEEGKAGQTARAQLSITSNAHADSAPIVLHSVQVQFEGSIKPIILAHDPDAAEVEQKHGKATLSSVKIRETPADDAPTEGLAAEALDNIKSLDGSANLVLAPGHTVVFEMDVPLREPGQSSAAFLVLCLQTDTFEMEYTAAFRAPRSPSIWYNSPSSKKRVSRANPLSIRIAPRPPKMEIKGIALMDQYYTSEPLELQFEIINAEDVDASVKLDAVLFGETPPDFALKVRDGDDEHTSTSENEESKIFGVAVGHLESSQAVTVTARVNYIELASRYEFTIRVGYHLSTDPATLITQSAVFQLNIVNPFEANYDLLPRLHPEPWPSLFDHDTVLDPSSGEDDTPVLPKGLAQTWCLVTRYASFAAENLKVVDLDLRVHPSPSIRTLATKLTSLPAEGLQVSPKTIEEASFNIAAQKTSLDERVPSSLEVSFLIKWTRPDAPEGTAPNVTTLPVPRLNIFGTEPRVLATAAYVDPEAGPEPSSPQAPGAGSSVKEKLLVLDVVIENPSNHFLTFGLAMEPSDEFAFSGAKQTTLHLLPVSRRSVTYRLLPLVKGAWIKPGLVVRDKYFQKVLRVIPTAGMKLDKEGFLVWVPPDFEDEE